MNDQSPESRKQLMYLQKAFASTESKSYTTSRRDMYQSPNPKLRIRAQEITDE